MKIRYIFMFLVTVGMVSTDYAMYRKKHGKNRKNARNHRKNKKNKQKVGKHGSSKKKKKSLTPSPCTRRSHKSKKTRLSHSANSIARDHESLSSSPSNVTLGAFIAKELVATKHKEQKQKQKTFENNVQQNPFLALAQDGGTSPVAEINSSPPGKGDIRTFSGTKAGMYKGYDPKTMEFIT